VARRRNALRVAFGALGLGLLAIPVVAVALSGTASADLLWTTLRLAALEAVTLMFIAIVLSAFRPLFNKVVRPRTAQGIHQNVGLVGFSLAVAHGTMALVFGISGYRQPPVWVGPAVLALLVVTMVGALYRRRLRRSWRWIHRLNYLLFAAILVHGFVLGYDLGSELWLRIWFGIYVAVVAAGLAYKVAGTRSRDTRPQTRGAGGSRE
jgi:DMSO/TMAO reductase YedYZ heme-binding membrane subunit